MSMGVLNNIAATYAANNLSNTQASLQNVLTQLSSGSRINSGADDAAGLSLADGLQANQSALTQSASNVSLGVGLLQTADGALSQVNNLLNRAVTLATEAGNGTLNGSQYGAANQEYQSILAEINSIGATTTYNGQAVFGAQTGTAAAPATADFSIYTSDGSATGTSTDTLSIAQLSSASVGDTGGTIASATTGNGITYTVAMKSGAKFHDGSAITADDVVFSMERILAMKKGAYGLFKGVIDPGIHIRVPLNENLDKVVLPVSVAGSLKL